MYSKCFMYIAGPMSGIKDYNEPAFMTASYTYEKMGYNVMNPLTSKTSRMVQAGKLSGQEAYRACLEFDMNYLCTTATHILMMKGWERSSGARAEWELAVALKLHIIYE